MSALTHALWMIAGKVCARLSKKHALSLQITCSPRIRMLVRARLLERLFKSFLDARERSNAFPQAALWSRESVWAPVRYM
eukprot:6191290-Pleurochrysis_carterae.AAC.5